MFYIVVSMGYNDKRIFVYQLITYKGDCMSTEKKPNILVLGGNFAGLQTARHLHEHIKDKATITVVDRKSFLLFIPNIPLEIFEGNNPTADSQLPIAPILEKDGTRRFRLHKQRRS